MVKVGKSQGTCVSKIQGKLGSFAKNLDGNNEGKSHNFEEFEGAKACFLRVKLQI